MTDKIDNAFRKRFPGTKYLGLNVHNHLVAQNPDGSKIVVKCRQEGDGFKFTVVKEVPRLGGKKKKTTKTKPAVRLNAGDDSDRFWNAVNKLMDADANLSQAAARKQVGKAQPSLAASVPDQRIAQTNPHTHKLMAETEQLVTGGMTRTEARRRLVQTSPDLVWAGEGRTPDERHAGALGVYLSQGLDLSEAMIRADRDLPADAAALALNAL